MNKAVVFFLAVAMGTHALAQGPPEPITLRSVKGATLTHAELDDDLENLVHLFTGANKSGTTSAVFSFYLPMEASLTAGDCDAASEKGKVRIDLSAAGTMNWLAYCKGATGWQVLVDDDVPDAGDFSALALTGDITSSGLATTVAANSVALGTDTTGGYAASASEAGSATSVAANSVALGTDTTGGYAASVSEAGPATTATALAANGADCAAGNYPLGVDVSGAVESCTADDDIPDAADFGALALTGDITSSGLATTVAANSVALGTDTTGGYAASVSEGGPATTATALDANPADCSANQFATTIAASGALTCAAIVDADVPDTVTASNYLPLAGGTLTGPLLVPLGTAALPSITPTGDPNTGIYSPGADQLALNTAGAATPRLYIDSTGNVGIGTASPSAKLTMALTSTYDGITISGNVVPRVIFNSANTSTLYWGIGTHDNNANNFAIGHNDNVGHGATTNRLVITSTTGNVGIGDITPDDLLNVHSATAASAIAITSLGTDTDSLIKFELADGTPNFVLGVDDSVAGDPLSLNPGTALAAGGSTSLTMYSTGGVTIGTPTGGDKGAGTLNATAVYDDDVLLSDYVFEPEYSKASLAELAEFVASEKHLPTIDGREVWERDGKFSLGKLATQLWETVEVQALYILELNAAIATLQARLDVLEQVNVSEVQ